MIENVQSFLRPSALLNRPLAFLTMFDIELYAQKLSKDITSLPEEAMRLVVLKKRLQELSPEHISRLLSILLRKTEQIHSLLLGPDLLLETLGPELFHKAYQSSLDFGLMTVSPLFTALPPKKGGLYHGYEKEEEIKMEHLTLGERRALSKGFNKDMLSRLLSDPDPMVIKNLLDNPKTTEREALRVASKRPNSSKILDTLARHIKWSKNYNVRKAIIQNPYTMPRVSVLLMGAILTADLEAVASDATLHRQVSTYALDLLRERSL